jgi:hypothetical protein
MKPLREWSFARLMLACIGWVILCLLIFALWLYSEIRADLASGSGGIGAVSVGIAEPVIYIPLGPPIILVLAWLIARWRR